jgi:hypothetical protein
VTVLTPPLGGVVDVRRRDWALNPPRRSFKQRVLVDR